MNALQITRRDNRRDRERTAQLVMIGILIAQGEVSVHPTNCCDPDIAALVEQCQDKSKHANAIRQWFKDKAGVQANDGESMPDAVQRTVNLNGQRKALSALVQTAATQAGNWSCSDDDFIRLVQQLAAKG